ncbi:MAG: Mur ligase [Gammaproteobacteria bacterium]|nr:MAG: Mur ligase [Gammaproteobacteria bacterium]
MEIPEIESSKLVLDDGRRLTGPSMIWSKPGAILDVLIAEMDMEIVLDCWHRQLRHLVSQIGWQHHEHTHRRFENGFNLLIESPIDQLYAAVLILETNWYFCCCELLAIDVEDEEALVQEIRNSIEEESNPALLALQQAAAEHEVDFLVDDDEVSIGHGEGSLCWPVNAIPAIDQIPWSEVHDIPVALITGTNGKSTSVRLLDGIARAAAQISGVTSTDFVRVGNDVLDHGDYSGPGGARLLLRDKRLQVAFLEVARGGILRRGLPLRRASAALVTNIASDHLGQYGVNTLEALTEVKFAVRKTLAEDGMLIVNADDENCRAYMEKIDHPNLCWFSLDKDQPRIKSQLEKQGKCCYTEENRIYYFDGRETHDICEIDLIPMTLGGAALHNVRNALGAVGVATALGYSVDQIRSGLTKFHSDEHDNPGRLNTFKLKNGATIIVDFAHNAHSVEAVSNTVLRMPAQNKWVMFGSAGDRSDDDIIAIAKGVCAINPDHVVIIEIERYLRGREPGEVSEIIKQACLDGGMAQTQLHFSNSPLQGVKLAIAELQANDLGLFLVLSERDEIIQYIGEH